MSKPITSKMYALHALDLAERRPPLSKDRKFYPLNLVDLSTDTNKKAKVLETLSQRTLAASRQRLYLPVPEYAPVNAVRENPLICEQLKIAIEKDVAAFKKSNDYNSLNAVLDFLSFFEKERAKNPNISEAEAFTKFLPDSRNEVSAFHGSSCVGKSIAALKMLEENHKVKGFVILELQNLLAPANHAAALVPCKDGVVLVEMLADEPVKILKPKEKSPSFKDGPVMLDFEIIEMPTDYRTTQPVIVMGIKEGSSEVTYVQYLLRPAINPDNPVMKKYLLEQNFYPVLGDGDEGNTHVIKVNYILEKVTFQIGEKENAKKYSVPFKIVESERLEDEASRAFLTQKFFSAFKAPAHLLKEQIVRAASHSKTMNNLLRQVGRLNFSSSFMTPILQMAEKGEIEKALQEINQNPSLTKLQQIELRAKIGDICFRKGNAIIDDPKNRIKARRHLSFAALSYDYLLNFEQRMLNEGQIAKLKEKKELCSKLLQSHSPMIGKKGHASSNSIIF